MKTAIGLTAVVLVILLLTAIVGSLVVEGRVSAASGDLSADQPQDPYPGRIQRVPILYLDFVPGTTPPPYP